jgi:hypothetical protein
VIVPSVFDPRVAPAVAAAVRAVAKGEDALKGDPHRDEAGYVSAIDDQPTP